MAEPLPAVALLFDDMELGGQLREALREHGARIVHEGGVAGFSRELQQQLDADVLVVNLDDGHDDALDRLYDMIDGVRPRLVFNDAQASRALSGWDRARWARHLAVKVLAMGDLDPPRPQDAPAIAMRASAPVAVAVPVAIEAAPVDVAPADDDVTAVVAHADAPSESAPHPHDDVHEAQTLAASENLAAELEALLAAAESPGSHDTREAPLPPEMPLHDGNFGVVPPDHESPWAMHAAEPVPAPATTTVTPPQAPDSWSLLDDAPLSGFEHIGKTTTEPVQDATVFGIEKLSAADFLAPAVEHAAPDSEPVMNLQLVSMEEAVAPQAWEPLHEMVLDDLDAVPGRVVLLGAAVDGVDSVCAFLAALPVHSRYTFLHTQHMGTQPVEALREKFAAHSALPLRMAMQGSRARAGEVLLVPTDQQVRLRRDGSIELQAHASGQAQEPSIDASFTMAAGVFGRDALAIVFAGRSTDAVAGAQAIHDRGGQVWVESSSGEHFADMVSGIFAERLVSYSGTPHELAAHLIEVYP